MTTFGSLAGTVKLINSSEELNKYQVFLDNFLRKHLEKQPHLKSRKTTLQKARMTVLPYSDAIVLNFKYQTDFLQTLDIVFGWRGVCKFEGDSVSF